MPQSGHILIAGDSYHALPTMVDVAYLNRVSGGIREAVKWGSRASAE